MVYNHIQNIIIISPTILFIKYYNFILYNSNINFENTKIL